MAGKEYFHLRTSDGTLLPLSLDDLRAATAIAIRRAFKEHLLSERCGYDCFDDHSDVGSQESFAELLMFDGFIGVAAPVADNLHALDERELIGLHEVVHDLVSSPTKGYYHDYNHCGFHPTEYDAGKGRAVWIERVNRYLTRFPPGYLMGADGRVSLLLDEPEAALLGSKLPPQTEPKVRDRVDRAVSRFRRGTSSWDDREAAVRDLADVLELIRPKAKAHLFRRDEQAIFNLLNSFQIRHFDSTQKSDYDRRIFLTWAFYECLAAIHACERLAARATPED